jgi:hypothetical protein
MVARDTGQFAFVVSTEMIRVKRVWRCDTKLQDDDMPGLEFPEPPGEKGGCYGDHGHTPCYYPEPAVDIAELAAWLDLEIERIEVTRRTPPLRPWLTSRQEAELAVLRSVRSKITAWH